MVIISMYCHNEKAHEKLQEVYTVIMFHLSNPIVIKKQLQHITKSTPIITFIP